MKRLLLIAALVALSGCSRHDTESDFQACTAESLKTNVLKDERPEFLRACMGGKGYGYTDNQVCLKLIGGPLNLPDCFYKRGLRHDLWDSLGIFQK